MKVGAASTRRAMNRSESESSLSSESELSDDEVSPLSRRASGCRPLPLAARCPLPAARCPLLRCGPGRQHCSASLRPVLCGASSDPHH